MRPESLLAQREVLYFIHAPGCAACEAAEPEFSAFEQQHPRLLTMRVFADGAIVERLGLKVKATPTYLFRRGNDGETKVGALKVKDLEAWLKKLGAEL